MVICRRFDGHFDRNHFTFCSFALVCFISSYRMDLSRDLEVFKPFVNYFEEEISDSIQAYIANLIDLKAVLAPVIVKFEIDYEIWSKQKELRPALEFIINEPTQSQNDLRMSVWLRMFSIVAEKQLPLQSLQVHCILRVANLPRIERFEFVPFRHPIRLSLTVMKCVLHSYGDRQKYVRQSVWFCPKQCHNSQNSIIEGSSGTSHLCSECNVAMQEYEVS